MGRHHDADTLRANAARTETRRDRLPRAVLVPPKALRAVVQPFPLVPADERAYALPGGHTVTHAALLRDRGVGEWTLL